MIHMMSRIAVMGPFAEDTDVMLGNYEGIPEFVRSVADGVKKYQPDAVIAPVLLILEYHIGMFRCVLC